MDNKVKNTTSTDVSKSVSSIYSELLEKRRIEREEKEERKRLEREEREREKEEKKKDKDGDRILTKKERQEAAAEAWKEIVVGLTGDDLEYFDEKKKKKKYRKWIDDDDAANAVLSAKPKKIKKKNYRKEFESELNMLKNLVADQNKFTADLQKRYNVMAGPNTRDAMPLNKTQVELASVINASRSNALGVLNAIGSVKKTVADLYLRQQKQDYDIGKGGVSGASDTDIGLLGSSIASAMFGDAPAPSMTGQVAQPSQPMQEAAASFTPIVTSVSPTQQPGGIQAESFDPSTWEGPSIGIDNSVMYESIPHDIVVELRESDSMARFKAVRRDTGEELVGCPVPTTDPSKLKFNMTDKTVKGEFDESYKLELI